MAGDIIDRLETLLAGGRDDALLRFGLGGEYLRRGDPERAIVHLERAVTHDATYSAAWKLLGRAMTEAGRRADAEQAYTRGVAAAEARGDIQAAREMRVFLKRLRRGSSAPDPDSGQA